MKNARAFVVLSAAMITQILNIRYERDMVQGLLLLILVIAIFYVIASVAIKLIDLISGMEKVKHVDLPSESEHESETEKAEKS